METLMSKGPGRLQRDIDALFTSQPDTAFTVEDSCRHVYQTVRPTKASV
jgi:hypothetical protein